MSSCVSKFSSIIMSSASGSTSTAAAASSTFLGGIVAGVCYFCPFCNVSSAIKICSYLTPRANFDSPSTSSNNFSLFLWRSTELVSSCNVVGPSAPVILALWRSPKAACSYFSTAAIFSYTANLLVVDLAVAAGCVELSFSYSTMSSTSCSRS